MVSWTINCRTGHDSSRGLGPGIDNFVVLTCRAKNILFLTLFNFFNFSKKMYNFFIGIAIFMCQFHGANFIPGRYFTLFGVKHSESLNLSKRFHTLNLLPKKFLIYAQFYTRLVWWHLWLAGFSLFLRFVSSIKWPCIHSFILIFFLSHSSTLPSKAIT